MADTVNGRSVSRLWTGATGGDSISPTAAAAADLPWLGQGTLIDTAAGPIAIDALQPGARVLTRDGGFHPVLAVRTLDCPGAAELLRPVILPRGVLGAEAPLVLSPAHGVFVRDATAELYFGTRDALVAANALLTLPDVRVAPLTSTLSYRHLIFDQHQIIRANGVWVESLFVGSLYEDGALGGLARITPEAADLPCHRATARAVLRGFEAEVLTAGWMAAAHRDRTCKGVRIPRLHLVA